MDIHSTLRERAWEIFVGLLASIWTVGKIFQSYKELRLKIDQEFKNQKDAMNSINNKIDDYQRDTTQTVQQLMQITIKSETEIKNINSNLNKIEQQLYNLLQNNKS